MIHLSIYLPIYLSIYLSICKNISKVGIYSLHSYGEPLFEHDNTTPKTMDYSFIEQTMYVTTTNPTVKSFVYQLS